METLFNKIKKKVNKNKNSICNYISYIQFQLLWVIYSYFFLCNNLIAIYSKYNKNYFY